MKSPYLIALEGGVTLLVEKDQVTYTPCAQSDCFTVSMQNVVRKLAQNLNRYVSYQELYEVYEGRTGDDIGRNLQRMKDRMPTAIKTAIKVKNGFGYMLVGTPVEQEVKPEQSPSDMLTGDYYGFFLDPVGNGAVLGAYLHVEAPNPEVPELAVTAVMGLRRDEILFAEDLSRIFSEKPEDRYPQFREFHDACGVNDRRCFWGEGSVRLVKNVAEWTLTTPKGAKWSIMIKLGNYLEGGRSSYPGEDGKYRGGKGIYAAIATQYGTVAGKFGLIRTTFGKSCVSVKNPDLQSMLRIPNETGTYPVIVPDMEDNYWYNWFMSAESN